MMDEVPADPVEIRLRRFGNGRLERGTQLLDHCRTRQTKSGMRSGEAIPSPGRGRRRIERRQGQQAEINPDGGKKRNQIAP